MSTNRPTRVPEENSDHTVASPSVGPLFSVIVPFLNEEGWLPKCLAALRSQSIDPGLVEWILIDNGSTDRSAEIVQAEPRRAPSIARNRGILAARGEYLAFLDADCLAEPDWLEAMPVVGDTEIIHRLRQRQPNAVVRYAAAARVVHGEVDSFRMCLTKTYEIGAHAETLARVSPYRTLSLAERLRVVGRCCRMHGYGPGRWLALWGILGLGYAAFLARRLTRGVKNQGRPR
jgi:glycosyltransferase involved in cell wall biosynthesis